MKYCIFKVYDYKGGELSTSVNLDYDEFIGELSDLFENIDIDSISERRDRNISKILGEDSGLDKDIKVEVEKILKSRDFYSTYAGGDGFCGECYEVDNNNLKRVKIENYVDDIVKYIIKNWL